VGKIIHGNEIISGDDLQILKWQLGQESIRLLKVVKRCRFGYPMVILLNPMTEEDKVDYKSISNPMWLTCPFLNKKIHELESNGYIIKVKEFIDSDPDNIEIMRNAHVNYYYLRRSIFNMNFTLGEAFGKYSKILSSGVGGTKDIEHVKCLHQHFGHFLVCNDNIVGRVVNGLLDGIINCQEEMCKDAVNRESDP